MASLPHLLDLRTTPQSLALHEAIGDITGLLIAISSRELRKEVLAKTKGSIDDATTSVRLVSSSAWQARTPALCAICTTRTQEE